MLIPVSSHLPHTCDVRVKLGNLEQIHVLGCATQVDLLFLLFIFGKINNCRIVIPFRANRCLWNVTQWAFKDA